MDFLEVIKQARVALQTERRITYRVLKRQFALDDESLEELKEQLIDAEEVAADKDGKMLVWTGGETSEETASKTVAAPAIEPLASASSAQSERETPAGERRQLTVMFCDLVGSTALSEQLDPEELQSVVRTYQEVSAQVIERYEGYIAQYLGDGLLVYFGYPAAHEDDAVRSIRAGLEILSALQQARGQFPQPVQVRIGIHTGPAVVGEMGGGSRHEQLALGETPNIAARVQGKAEPDEVVISAATQRLVAGLFETEDRGRHELKGISTPQPLYRVTAESPVRSRFEVAMQAGLTPLAGREHELGVLRERWTQAQTGEGQVVLLSGEPGIGKSRLVQELKAQVMDEGATPIEFRCSPYHLSSALYPLIEHLQRLLQFAPDDTPETKRAKLQQLLGRYRFPQADTLSLLTSLLSLPHPEGVWPLTVSPQKQKELTYAALVAWLLEETEQQPVYNSWEDLHWADPSTLEVLELLLSQVPTSRLLAVLTFRPEFVPPWRPHSYLSQLTLGRLGQPSVNVMVERVTGGKLLPEEVMQQIVTKTDGVPLFVEELTKTIMESDAMRAVNGHYELAGPLSAVAIPATLHDSLMARLDRLGAAKEVAQLGAVIGREFSYELLRAVAALEETVLQHGLQQLVDAELVYPKGVLPQRHYIFKHALIQDTAYESLLKSNRRQVHQQIAQVLAGQFRETTETHPELVAHHYTEAGLVEQALPYWQQAGVRATQRSANAEAVRHLTTGLRLLPAQPSTPEQRHQELALQIALGIPLVQAKGFAAPEVARVYSRARELCRQLDDTTELFPVLRGLWSFYLVGGDFQSAREIAEQLLSLAHRAQDSSFLVEAHQVMGYSLYYQGQCLAAQDHLERVVSLYDLKVHGTHVFRYGGGDPGVACHSLLACTLWGLGYPDQADKRNEEALALAEELSHPFSLAFAQYYAVTLHQCFRRSRATQKWAETLVALAMEQAFPYRLAQGSILRGWALAEQEQVETGITQLHQGIAAVQATGAEMNRPYYLAQLAAAYGKAGQPEKGLDALTDGLALIETTGERWYEAETYRVKGALLLQQSPEKHPEAAACFHTALEVARQQEAKSWELRAAMSLARLWQSQAKTAEARALLAPVYEWFTEGFDTADLKDAKALLEHLA